MSTRSESISTIQSSHFACEATDAASKSVAADRLVRVARHINSHELVLDLGSNDGAAANILLQKKARVLASDFPNVIRHARKKFPELFCVGFDASRGFPISAQSLDSVTASEIMEHIVDDRAFLRECHRVLKPGGKLVLTTPNLGFVRDRIWLLCGHFQDNPMHVHLYTFKNIRKKILEAGFRDLEEEGYHYNLSQDGFWENFREHRTRIGFQNAFWYLLENLLPKTFKAGIVICARKP